MRDKGLVVETGEDMARIRVNCASACDDCSARSICGGRSGEQGLMDVRNPVRAHPGDEVLIEIPESKFNRALILIFGSLLVSAPVGMILGWAGSRLSGASSSVTIPAGFFLGLALASLVLIRMFRGARSTGLYPYITEIIQKGGNHG